MSVGFGIFSSWKREKIIGDKVARFRQLNVNKPNVHYDALEFSNGDIVFVTQLSEGQHATVLGRDLAQRGSRIDAG